MPVEMPYVFLANKGRSPVLLIHSSQACYWVATSIIHGPDISTFTDKNNTNAFAKDPHEMIHSLTNLPSISDRCTPTPSTWDWSMASILRTTDSIACLGLLLELTGVVTFTPETKSGLLK